MRVPTSCPTRSVSARTGCMRRMMPCTTLLAGAPAGRSRVQGIPSFIDKCPPVHFCWGSFDLAVTRFSGRRAPRHPSAVFPFGVRYDYGETLDQRQDHRTRRRNLGRSPPRAQALFRLDCGQARDGVDLEAEDLASRETIACSYSDFARHFGFFLPLAGDGAPDHEQPDRHQGDGKA
jgi:hypothetical protein